MLVKTNLPLPKEKQAILLSDVQLNLIKGKYNFGGGIIIPVTIEGDKIYIQQPGQDKEEILAETETDFFSKNDFTVEFIKDKGIVTRMIVNVGVKYEGKKNVTTIVRMTQQIEHHQTKSPHEKS